MDTIEVSCPSCNATLKVPAESVGKRGRCKACRTVFPIIALISQTDANNDVNEDSVFGWLSQSSAGKARSADPEVAAAETRIEKAIVDTPAPPPEPPAEQDAEPAAAQAEAFEETPVQPPAPGDPSRPLHERITVKLGHLDDMGAFFVFPPETLYDEDFRASLPQRCIICGGKHHLSVHLVMWSSKLPERGRIGTHTSYARSIYELDDFEGISGRDLLARLNPVENLPPPYNLPMPYYVCRSCSAVGAVVTDVRFTADGARQVCELGICSLKRAMEFARRVCGPELPVHVRIRDAIRRDKHNAWRTLPLAVRCRINQWYEPDETERFVAYVPDGDFSKSEAGTAGIVVTNRRMVYRKFAAKVDIPLTEPITISPKVKDDRLHLEILCAVAKPVMLSANEATAAALLRHLASQGAKTEWATA